MATDVIGQKSASLDHMSDHVQAMFIDVSSLTIYSYSLVVVTITCAAKCLPHLFWCDCHFHSVIYYISGMVSMHNTFLQWILWVSMNYP